MRRAIASLALCLMLVGCESRTEFGPCIGINGKHDPALEYNYSALNIFFSVIFFETIFVPLIVGLTALECPVAKK